jgi:hypothetical protein
MLRDGRLQTAVAEWLSNVRHPLRTAPLVLLAPSLLTAQFGFMATSLPFLGLFLGLLGLHVHRRTGSLPYALACMALFAALPGLLNPRFGLAVYWLETVASPLLGSALLCLLLSDRGRHLGWLAAFATFAALACLSRYVTVAFAGFLCGPIVLAYLGRRLWEERSLLRALLLPILVIGVVGGLLAGDFLIGHFKENQLFYSYLGPVGLGKRKALELIVRMQRLLIGGTVGTTLAASACLLTFVAFRRGPISWLSLLQTAWIGGALPVLLVLQGAGADEAAHVVWFTVPPLFIALAAPLPLRSSRKAPDCTVHDVAPEHLAKLGFAATDASLLLRRLAAAVAVVAVGLFVWTAVGGWRDAGAPPPNIADQKRLDVALADALTSQGDGLIWNAYFDEYAWIPTIEAFYRTGTLVVPAGQPFYHHWATHWEFEYPGYSPEALAQRIVDGTNRYVDVAVVFDDPADADRNVWMTNPHSRAVSRAVAQEVRANPAWARIATVESVQYGRLAVYHNRMSRGAGYDQALRGQLWP